MLLSMAFSPIGNVLVAGTSNGIIYAARKKEKKEEAQDVVGIVGGCIVERKKPVLRPTNYRYFQRGQSEKPLVTDIVVKQQVKVKLAEHDRLVKKLEHKEALLSVLKRKNPNTVVAVMQELVARRKLLMCVETVDEERLGLLLSFLHRNTTMPRYARFLMGLATRVLQMRDEDIRSSPELKTHARNIKRMVAEETAMMPRYARFLMGLATRVLQMCDEGICSSPELKSHARKKMVAVEMQIQRTF